MNRWLIFLIASGLILGFAGVLVHEPRSIGLGLLTAVAGLWLAIHREGVRACAPGGRRAGATGRPDYQPISTGAPTSDPYSVHEPS